MKKITSADKRKDMSGEERKKKKGDEVRQQCSNLLKANLSMSHSKQNFIK